MKSAPETWKLIYEKFDPEEEKLREALCTLGNGYMGSRGSAPEALDSDTHYPGNYIAGVYNRTPTQVGGRPVYNDDLVNCPNWGFITYRIADGKWFSPLTNKILFFHQELNMKTGVLYRKMRVRDQSGRLTFIESSRIVSMADPHFGAIKYSVTPENYSDFITVKTMLDATVVNNCVERYSQLNSQHLVAKSAGFTKDGLATLSVRTSQSKVEIACTEKLRTFVNRTQVDPFCRKYTEAAKKTVKELRMFVARRKTFKVEKLVCVHTSRTKDPGGASKASLRKARSSQGFDVLLKAHKKAWAELWDNYDFQIEGDEFTLRTLRLHTFHLLQTASHYNAKLDVGFPARGVHGEAYRGHVFWDEIFALWLYDLHAPEVSAALLKYRYKRIKQAREYAKEYGFKGAMFPWQSSASGEEETQITHLNPMSGKWDPDYSSRQRHVSFAIAANVWRHWFLVRDMDFLKSFGAEIILSIAQFCASLVQFQKKDRRYHTKGIMGPDEFHEKLPKSRQAGLKDNAYSNFMISWVLIRAHDVLKALPKAVANRLLKKLGITAGDIAHWDEISSLMKVNINPEGVIEQFDGYFGLKELDWAAYRRKYKNIQRMDRILKAENKSPDEYKVAKQADVLMLFYVLPVPEIKTLFNRLGYVYRPNTLKVNYDYYVKRTSHGSTLSKVVHCYLAHLLGREKESLRWYREVLQSDVHDTQGGTTNEGIHCGVMGGSLEIAFKGFAGVSIMDDRVRIVPRVPLTFSRIKFSFMLRGVKVCVDIYDRHVGVKLVGPGKSEFELPFEIRGKLHRLKCGSSHQFVYVGKDD